MDGAQGVQGVQDIQGIRGETGSLVSRSECILKHEKLVSLLEEINNRLYRDNGHLSIQTRLDRGDRILGVLCWVTTVAGGAIILAAVAFVIKLIVLHTGAQ
jgi:hypothetical protein